MNSALPLDDYLMELLGAPSAPAAVVSALPTVEVVPSQIIVADSTTADAAMAVVAVPAAARIAPMPMPASTPASAVLPANIQHEATYLPASLSQPPATEDSFHRRRTGDHATRWLRLRCDQQHYALELLKVQEVILPGLLLPLRGAPRHMLGVMNLRGHVVPVMDLGLYLGRDPCREDAATRIVVLEENGDVLGLRVTTVEDVTKINDQQIEPPDDTRISRITNQVFRGVARLGGNTIILLDASRLLQ